jgi:hypothetical protein
LIPHGLCASVVAFVRAWAGKAICAARAIDRRRSGALNLAMITALNRPH